MNSSVFVHETEASYSDLHNVAQLVPRHIIYNHKKALSGTWAVNS
jgi:hypothetical protein